MTAYACLLEIFSWLVDCFTAQLLPQSFRTQSWGLMHSLLEMFTYRQHHVQPHYRIQLLGHLKTLHEMPNIPAVYQNQMFIWYALFPLYPM